jgi:hypothetical protein
MRLSCDVKKKNKKTFINVNNLLFYLHEHFLSASNRI